MEEKNTKLQELAKKKFEEFYRFVWDESYRYSYSEAEARGDEDPNEFAEDMANDTLNKVKESYPTFHTGLGKIYWERHQSDRKEKEIELDLFNAIGLEESPIAKKETFLNKIKKLIKL